MIGSCLILGVEEVLGNGEATGMKSEALSHCNIRPQDVASEGSWAQPSPSKRLQGYAYTIL
jgi:hypothetical protein